MALEALSGAAGAAEGLSEGTSQMLQYQAMLRDQDIKFKTSMHRISLGMKQLNEHARQSDMAQARFYDGLNHKSLLQTRDIKVRKQLQALRDEAALARQNDQQAFLGAAATTAHGRNLELTREQHEANKELQKLRNGPAYARIALQQKQQDFIVSQELTQQANEFITNAAMDANGKLSRDTFQDKAYSLGYIDAETNRGNSARYAQELYNEFSASMRNIHGDDVSIPDSPIFSSLIRGVVNGDARGQKEWMDGVANKLASNFLQLPAQHATSIVNNAMNPDSSIPMMISANGDLVSGGRKTDEWVAYIQSQTESFNNAKRGGGASMENWVATFDKGLEDSMGQILGVAPGNRSNMTAEDRAMFQIAFEKITGSEFPLNVSGMSPETMGLTKSLIQNSSGIPDTVDGAGDVVSGTTRRQARDFSSIQQRTIGSITSSRENFSDAWKRGDQSGMFREYATSTEELKNTIEEIDRMPEGFANSAMIKASLEDWRVLLDNMSKQMMGKGAEPTEAGLFDLEQRYTPKE